MNRIGYLQGQYDHARVKWWAAGPAELRDLRDQMFRLAGPAENWIGDDGAPLGQSMRTLACGIDDHLFANWPPGVAENT